MLNTRMLLVIPVLVALIGVSAFGGDAPKATVTTLTVSALEVEIGAPVTLNAQVTNDTLPVQRGSVVFCDANATRCEGPSVLGRVQLTRSGTATLKLTLGSGNHAITATFEGTRHSDPALSPSTSTAQSFAVKATRKTTSTQGSMRQ